MSNLQSAKIAIQAELYQARAGLAYYQSRAEKLEKALAQLAPIGTPGGAPAKIKGKAQKHSSHASAAQLSKATAAKSATKTKKFAPAGRLTANDKASGLLPFTGGDYWTNLLSDQPISGPEILKAAINKLGFAPSKEQVRKLSGRMTFALNALAKSKKIQDSGSGRERRFFKA